MKSLSEYIREQMSHIRDIYIIDQSLYEELGKIKDIDYHAYCRKLGIDDAFEKPTTNLGGVNDDLIKDTIYKIDNIVVDGLLSKRIKNTNKYDYENSIGVIDGDSSHSLMIIGFIVNFNRENFKYDLHVLTVGRRDKLHDVDNVKLRIHINKKHKKIDWDVPELEWKKKRSEKYDKKH